MLLDGADELKRCAFMCDFPQNQLKIPSVLEKKGVPQQKEANFRDLNKTFKRNEIAWTTPALPLSRR